MNQNYYDVLGVSKDASQDDIKQAYRKLAKEWHPDKHKSEKKKEAEAKFKEIASAYEILNDPQKREQYDRFGTAEPRMSGFGSGFPGFESDFWDINSIFGRRKPQRGSDSKVIINLTLEEAATGIKKTVSFKRNDICEECKGAGGTGIACAACNGSGHVKRSHMMGVSVSTCPSCRGDGIRITDKCTKCAGNGHINTTKKVEINIPPGVDSGEAVVAQHEGNMDIYDTPRGHVYFVINVKPHSIFERDGISLKCSSSIPMTMAALGGKISVQTIYGSSVDLSIPPGTQPFQVFRLKGKGLKRNDLIGDQYVEIHVEIPKNLSNEEKLILQKFAEKRKSP